MKQYSIHLLPNTTYDTVDMAACPAAKIDCYPWKDTANSFAPKAIAKLASLSDGLCVELFAQEAAPRREITEQNGPVCLDSCLEFFFNADPRHSKDYLNFEINPIGTLHLAVGPERKGRTRLFAENYQTLFRIKPQIHNEQSWQVRYFIPYTFLKEHYPQFDPQAGQTMAGNFYKCGDKTPHPHYGCWNEIVWDHPDFHRPEFFAPLVFAE